MTLISAAFLSAVFGLLVLAFSQERRVKVPFLVLCLSLALGALGLWVEINVERYAFAAARLNMTTALSAAGAALVSTRMICGFRVRFLAVAVLTGAAVANILTVWLTDAYFTGVYIVYGWGGYVEGNPSFVVTPLMLVLICAYIIVGVGTFYLRAHPFDRNRIKFVLLSYGFLSLSLLDFLPHFGIDLFGGPVSGFGIPLFVATFGYASLRYRLVRFHEMVARTSGWILTALVVGGGYILFLEASQRWLPLSETGSHTAGTFVALGLFAGLGYILPNWVRQLFGGAEEDLERAVEKFSNETTAIFDETDLEKRLAAVCADPFASTGMRLVDSAAFAASSYFLEKLFKEHLIEVEAWRRRFGTVPVAVADAELVVALIHQEDFLGVLLLRGRADGEMYSQQALTLLKTLANLYAVAVTNARAAAEIQKRHSLERYLAPQVVEGILGGNEVSLENRQRLTITVFFSDLKDFTMLADALAPETLSSVLQEYFSNMSDIAFRYGGTLDKFIGDAVMVFFGAPVRITTWVQAQRCVEMGLEMQRRLNGLNDRWMCQGLLTRPLKNRIGIHTGEAVVGTFGSRTRAEYTAIGRTVNLASRLESACAPGRILVSDETWSLVKGVFVAQPRGPILVKGFAQAVEAYELGLQDQPGIVV